MKLKNQDPVIKQPNMSIGRGNSFISLTLEKYFKNTVVIEIPKGNESAKAK